VSRLLVEPAAPLIGFTAALSVLACAYLGAGISLTPHFWLLGSFLWGLLVAMWVVADARHRRLTPCYDFGFFVLLTFPLSIIWYCLWSRGWRGLLWLVGLFGLWIAPQLVAMVFWLVLYGRS
jgi:hypothetical protein